jgi:exodeoxyribonuclease VII small subunit
MKNFEDRLARLEELGIMVKKNDVPLDKALAAFEEGMKLSFSLEKDLKMAEHRIEVLTNGADIDEDEHAGAGAEEEKPELELFAPLTK